MRMPKHRRIPTWIAAPTLAVVVLAGCNAQASTPQADAPIPHPLDPLTAERAIAVIQKDILCQHIGAMVGWQAPGTARTVASDSWARTARKALIERDILGA